MTFSLLKKACPKGKLLYPHSAQGAARGCSREGFKGRRVRDPAEGPLGLPFERRGHVNDLNYF
ncbi:hypothetical protein HMPREF0072_1049 [Anaerococcus lactolyticus ATCC 51172]|uniref:Uncharacterized protein n=1 Tax=Anaerococcus lactolyticus ATCC 51172 TaxID=525254 RepID=C2BFC9_9FIRM|nr:hypothetical protein HMPREF0072_1049 [Anaerococcus lactolyticus ATCC 51172]